MRIHSLASIVMATILMTSISAAMPAFSQEQEEHVEFAANLEYIRGHLAQAVANKQAGNTELAIAHAGHPVHEVYALIEGELAEHNADLNEELEEALTNLANQINGMSVEQVQTEVAHINSLLNGAETSVIS